MLSWGEVLLVMFRLFRCVRFRRGAFRRVLLHCVRVRLLRLPTFMCANFCLGEVCYREVTNLIKRKEALCF